MSVRNALRQTVVRRLADERGFVMIIALGVLLITSLLTAALVLAVQTQAGLSRTDLDNNRAYAAAQSGVQAYLQQLDAHAADSSWWQTCSNDSQSSTPVPGTTGEAYSYAPVVKCVQGKAVGTVVDPITGLLRMEFTGTSGQNGGHRTIAASFRPTTPLSYLWYTVHETVDPAVDPTDCSTEPFYYQGGVNGNCEIYWASGDKVNGPMYTQDQFRIEGGGSPQFGRVNSNDVIASSAPTTSVCAYSDCEGAVFHGKVEAGAPAVPLPSDNANLLVDAQNHGLALPGTMTLTLQGTTATETNCTASVASSCTTTNINLVKDPIIYATTAQGGTCAAYTNPISGITYPTIPGQTPTAYDAQGCGDVYVSGSYSTPVTIAAADDVIVTGDVIDSNYGKAGDTATLGLVANKYVRVQHSCANGAATQPRTIDGAILTLQHSFFVDNYSCGGQAQLTVNGAIAQYYRGIVAQEGTGGYIKNYTYDPRLALLMPPYMFDLQNTSWQVVRETLCGMGLPASNAQSCAYQGT